MEIKKKLSNLDSQFRGGGKKEERIGSMISPQGIDTEAEVVGSRAVESSTRSREAGNMRNVVRDFDSSRADQKRPIYISAFRRDSDFAFFAYDSTPFRSSTIQISFQSHRRKPSYNDRAECVFLPYARDIFRKSSTF